MGGTSRTILLHYGAVAFTAPAVLARLILYLFSCAIIIGFGEALRMARRRADQHRFSLWITLTAMTTGCQHV
jgi:hypothetical protein